MINYFDNIRETIIFKHHEHYCFHVCTHCATFDKVDEKLM